MFVDDIKVIRVKKFSYIERVKQELATTFKIVVIGPINFYLGLKMEKDRKKKILKLF